MSRPDRTSLIGNQAPWLTSRTRRLIELIAVVPALILTIPIMAVLAAVVAVVLGRPVLFRQTRSGREGKPICVTKFRTMSNAVDEHGRLLPDAQRLGTFGRALRSSSLDELPQLWSIISGELSLIGPRPLPETYYHRYNSTEIRRLEARPGLTGWAQIHGRNNVDWAERFALDVSYIETATWRVDLSVLLRTVRLLLTRSGTRASGHVTMPEFLGSGDEGSPVT